MSTIVTDILHLGTSYDKLYGADALIYEKGVIPQNQIWYTTTDGVFSGLNYNYIYSDAGTTRAGYDDELSKNNYGTWYFNNPVVQLGKTKVSSSGYMPFGEKTTLKTITIPEGVTTLGEHCFDGLSNLEEVKLPDSITRIDRACFENDAKLKTVNIPNGVDTIPSYCFYSCKSLESIIIPPSVKYIEWAAFQYCTSLKSIVIPGSVKTIGGAGTFNPISNIVGDVFMGCTSLTDIIIEEGVEVIEDNCFTHCPAVNLSLPDSLLKIMSKGGSTYSQGTFDYTQFETITIPENVIYIECGRYNYNAMINNNPNLKKIIWNVKSSTNVFKDNCRYGIVDSDIAPQLTELEFGEKVTYIPSLYWGTGGTNITSIISHAQTAPTLMGVVFKTHTGVSKTGTLHIPEGSDYSSWLTVLGNGWSVAYDA